MTQEKQEADEIRLGILRSDWKERTNYDQDFSMELEDGRKN